MRTDQSRSAIPLVILGGADRKAAILPPEGETLHPLTGCKGVDLRIDDRPLIEHLVQRYVGAGAFGPIYVAGPRTAYSQADIDAEVIDTDGAFGRNIRAGIEGARSRHPDGPIAFSTCDILPSKDDLDSVLEDYFAFAPSDLWFPMISAPADPEDLGESAWKPKYIVVTADGEEASVLPCHLAIVDPDALRLRFLYRLLDVTYQTRNRPIQYRRWFAIRKLLFGILFHDLLHMLKLQAPTLTRDTAISGWKAARRLRDQKLTQPELESVIRRLFAKSAHRKRFPQRRTRLPILEGLSLARDIDTWEEAAAFGARSDPASEP